MKKHKIIRDAKGAISLMLALLVVPFYSVAGILVEVQRYQSALGGMDDAINTSALAVLSEYDEFLRDRFGLLAIAQSENASVSNGYTSVKNMEKLFSKYMATQDTIDTRSFELTDTSVAGVYPLADLDVLKSQIMEYSALTVPTKMVTELDVLQEAIDKLQGMLPAMEGLTMAGDVAKYASSQLDMLDAFLDAKNSVNNLSEQTAKYDEKYIAFDEALEELKTTLQTEPGENASAAELEEYQKRYEEALKKAEDAKTDYLSSIDSEIGKTEDLSAKLKKTEDKKNSQQDAIADFLIDGVKKDVDDFGSEKETVLVYNKDGTVEKKEVKVTIDDQIKDVKERMNMNQIVAGGTKEELKAELEQLTETKEQMENIKTGITAVANGDDSSEISKIMEDYNSDSCGTAIKDLLTERDELKGVDLSTLTSDSIAEITQMQEGLHKTDMTVLSDYAHFSELLKETEDAYEEGKASINFFTKLAEVIKTFSELDITYDSKLQSIIDEDYYAENLCGLPSQKNRNKEELSLESSYEKSDRALAESNLNQIQNDFAGFVNENNWDMGSGSDISTSIGSGGWHITKLGEFAGMLSSISKNITNNLKSLGEFSAISTVSDKTLLMGYLLNTTSNRNNYASAKSLTGAGIKSSKGLADETEGGENNLLAWLSEPETNYSFSGAETEYLLHGDLSEKKNQKSVFWSILALRMALDFYPVKSNDQVILMSEGLATALAAVSAGAIPYEAGKWLGFLLLTFMEAWFDATLICNGAEDVSLIKASGDIYCSITGMSKLAQSITNWKISETSKKKIQEKVGNLEVSVKKAVDEKWAEDTKGIIKPWTSAGKSTDGIDIQLTYDNYLLLFMLTKSEGELLNRFADIIQMEQIQRNMVNNTSYSQQLSGQYPLFDLDKAYTTLRIEVKGKFVTVLPVPMLSKKSIWRMDHVVYRGY